MNYLGNNNIPKSKHDDDLLTEVTKDVVSALKNEYLFNVPDTWNFECDTKKITFEEIKEKLIEEGLSIKKAETYYGLPSSIVTDAYIITLTIHNGSKIIKKPLFMGEMKKQGTNDKRLLEGKTKQAIGNAAGDRTAKNFSIAADYCFLCDKEFFPYNVFLHGCDFGEDMTTTMKAKLEPFFGKLNNLNPFFDKDITWDRKGGSCFYQVDDYSYKDLYDKCYECCKIGVEHYLTKYNVKKQ